MNPKRAVQSFSRSLLTPLAAIATVTTIVTTLISAAPKASAHSVETDYLMSDKLEFTAKFSTGDPLQNAKVQVFAPGQPDKPWMEGETDADGKFRFNPDTKIPGDWQIRIGRGDHGDILDIPVTKAGVEVDKISSVAPAQPTMIAAQEQPLWQLAALGAIALGSSFGTTVLLHRKQ